MKTEEGTASVAAATEEGDERDDNYFGDENDDFDETGLDDNCLDEDDYDKWTAVPEDDTAEKAAQWMSGKWGIAWRVGAGNKETTKNFDVKKLVEQVQGIPGVSYVLFNLSQAAKGSSYTAPHSVLSKINPGSCPERDLFDDLATAFQAAGYKVLVYMMSEGPARSQTGPMNKKDEERIENWKAYVLDKYGSDDVPTLKKAYAEVIVREFAERYGAKIDGWWFDMAGHCDVPLLHDVCKKANPNAILAFNKGGKFKVRGNKQLLNNNPGYDDYTGGHPTPLRRCLPSDVKNIGMVKSVESSSNGFVYGDGKPSLGHMFMPMQERWNKGKKVEWSEEQALDWMGKVLNAGGAWTWNIPIFDKQSQLKPLMVDFASRIGSKLLEQRNGGGNDEL